jgi:hypothetical protein
VLAQSAWADYAAGKRAYDKGDHATAFKEWRPLAEQGDANAQCGLGNMYSQGPFAIFNQTEAARWYRKAADQGHAGAQSSLGEMYRYGKGVVQDYAEAARWYRKAADQGHAGAQSSLGEMYRYGKEVPQDYAEAHRWLRKAAEQGNADAQQNLAVIYSDGLGVPQDYAEAHRWMRKAAEQGEALAQFFVGLWYKNGRGVAQDYAEAARWYRKAAEQGDALAQQNLGVMCWLGQGMPEDYVLAHMWFNLAASRASGDVQKKAAGAREAVAQKMTPEQLAKAQELAREWRPKKLESSSAPGMAAQPRAVEPDSSGTGFWVNREGYLLTNHHVVDGCTVLSVKTLSGRQNVKVLAQDKVNDLAVVGPAKLNYAPLAFSENQRLKLGQGIITVGYPLHGLLASSLSLTTGTISAVAGIRDDTRMVQITAPVQPGNSGGPLLDQSGNVIGIVSSKLNSMKAASVLGDVTQNINFAVKGSVARTFLDSSGVNYVTSPSSATLETTVIGEKAKNAVALVECWR